MKSYNDLKQSQELATFLPMISADMYYPLPCTNDDIPVFGEGGFGSTPCWSLAALLDILNNRAYLIDEDASVTLSSYKTVEWDLSIINSGLEAVTNSDPIDAAVEMIIKLKEKDLL